MEFRSIRKVMDTIQTGGTSLSSHFELQPNSWAQIAPLFFNSCSQFMAGDSRF